MLVFVSDLHLTDGTSGETISPDAFAKFGATLQDMAENARAQEVEIVFLGDIYDVIRSCAWLQTKLRPWSPPGAVDGNRDLAACTAAIVEGIGGTDANRASMAHLSELRERMAARGISVQFTYVVGNHDWLVNRWPTTRQAVASSLGLPDPEQYLTAKFPAEVFWERYRVFARHGDIYDPLNFDDDRDASSVGDAIVIDLLNRFAAEVAKAPGVPPGSPVVAQLRELDNVRPLGDLPVWVNGVCRRAADAAVEAAVREVWNGLVDDFLAIDFVKQHDKAWQLDSIDALQLGLKISRRLSFEDLTRLPLRRFVNTHEDYAARAYREPCLRRNEAEVVVYGHTHDYAIVPLDVVPGTGSGLEKAYFNAGTWRKVYARTAMDRTSQEFVGWHVMTFLAFYLKDERGDRRFEVWNGALGSRRP